MSAPAPEATVTLPTGAVVTASMSPTERATIVARALGAQIPARPEGITFGPRQADGRQAHIDSTTGTLAQRDAAAARAAVPAKAPPAAPVVPPQGTPEERARDEAGRFAPVLPVGTPSPSTEYQQQLVALYKETPVAKRSTTEFQRAWHQEYGEALNGRQPGETRAAFLNRTAGRDNSAQPEYKPPEAAPAAKQFTPAQWEEGHKSVTDAEGWIPLERINKASLSGYELKSFAPGQRYQSSVFGQLATAKAAGFTQAQVDKYVEAQMREDGWIK